jgi:hypothetical protein
MTSIIIFTRAHNNVNLYFYLILKLLKPITVPPRENPEKYNTKYLKVMISLSEVV